MEKGPQLQILLHKYIANTITQAEYALLISHFGADHTAEELHALITQALLSEVADSDDQNLKQLLTRVDARIYKRITHQPKRKLPIRRFIPYAAAAILLLLGIGSYYIIQRTAEQDQNAIYSAQNDIAAGSNQASITLGDGRKYQLKDAQNGISINGHQIHYNNGEPIVTAGETTIVTLETPRGGQYRITLADGTKVFMNAGSQLRYPLQFTGDKREVQLQGEAYFEVAHNLDKPFVVHSGQQQILVLGTKFNINSFEQIIATTLVQGSVQVHHQEQSKTVTLQPGQQARTSNHDITVQKVLTDDYLGWTQNLFVFNDLPLSDIMKQIGRWYDVDTDFPTKFSDERFFAEIPRDRTLSQVLKDLEKAGPYKFEIQGRRVIVR